MKQFKKAIVAFIGAVAELAALGLLPSPYQEVAVAVVAIATAIGVFGVTNAPPPLNKPATTPLTTRWDNL